MIGKFITPSADFTYVDADSDEMAVTVSYKSIYMDVKSGCNTVVFDKEGALEFAKRLTALAESL